MTDWIEKNQFIDTVFQLVNITVYTGSIVSYAYGAHLMPASVANSASDELAYFVLLDKPTMPLRQRYAARARSLGVKAEASLVVISAASQGQTLPVGQ